MTVRCLVGLYGLNRSMRWTAASIKRKILTPLRDAKAQVLCFAHFNEPGIINSDHSGEKDIQITRQGLSQMSFEKILFEPQSEARLPSSALAAIDALPPGPRIEPRQTMVNLLFQLHSLDRLWGLVEQSAGKHDVFFFLRPDLEYLDAIRPETIFRQINEQGVDLITASWDQWGGLNDRFAFCSQKGAKAFARRIHMVPRFCEENGYLQAEDLLRSVAAWSDLKLAYTTLRAMRVRADGGTIREDFRLSPAVLARGMARKRIHRLRTILKGP